jgi:acetylornithine deacetylase
MGRVLGELEALDRQLQSRQAHHRLGAPSLHASIISGGRELSSYPDACRLELERRTVPGEPDSPAAELEGILARLHAEDREFAAMARETFARPPYAIDETHPLPGALAAAASTCGITAARVGMSFWTDAAVLGAAGTPSVLFGPGGAGLHSIEEYVTVADVITCRDVLAALALDWCGSPG